MSPILVSLSAKRIGTQMLVIEKLNGRRDFILRDFVCETSIPTRNYLFKVSYSSIRIRRENWIKNEDNGVVPMSLYLTVKIFQTCLIVDFEQANLFRVHLEKIALLKTRSGIMRFFALH